MAVSITTQNITDVNNMYVALFGRAPDGVGLGYWARQLAGSDTVAPKSLVAVANEMFAVDAARAYYPSALTNQEIVEAFYLKVLGRTADATGSAYWLAALNKSGATPGSVIVDLVNSVNNWKPSGLAADAATDAAGTISKNLFANKVNVSTYFGSKNGSIAAAELALVGVTDAIATVNTAKASIDSSSSSSGGQTFTLTTGVDASGTLIGSEKTTSTAGNDTFLGATSAGALTLSSLDAIDGGAGTDTLTIAATVAVDTTTMVGATVKNIENISITSTGAVIANTTAYTGLTSLATASTGNSTLTAAATTDVAATVAAPTGAGAAVINGGKAVTLNVTDTAAADTATGNTVTVGGTTVPAGAVVITQSETHAASGNAGASALATGSITVTGGTSVTVNSLASGAAGDNAGDVLTTGQVTVNGKGTVTNVSVTQSAATVAYAAAGDLYKITNGVVAITDNNTATKTDTIATVSLAHFGASTIQGNALTTLNLTGGGAAATASGTLGISQSASLTTGVPTTLTINMASGRVGVITDTNDQYTTLNVASAAAATIAGLDFTNATTLNVSGAGVTTVSASTDLAKLTAITSTGGGLALTGTLVVDTLFTGGAGKDSIEIGATKKAITTGAGDDTITISATALGTAGSVDAGEGTADTLSMTAANAVTASAGTTFETTISGFERLSLAAVAATGTVALANIDDLNDVAVAGVAAGQVLTLSGANSGVNLRFADATQTSTTVTLASNGSADVANVFLTTADEASTHSAIDLTGFETLNITSADSDTNAVAASNAITALTAGDATNIVVTGNAGLALAAGFTGTKVTSFNASAVTAGAVTYTAGALAAAATITGGAGADALSGASAAIAGVTINGGAGNDTITGSATKASTLNGDAGNDSITGGSAADVIDGGAGTNTYVFSSANVVEQAGASGTTGAVINLSSAALAQSSVFTTTGAYLTTTAPSVAAGTSTYLFDGESSTNASVIDTLANIQNVTGTNLADYIVGSDAANVIIGGIGNDFLTGGAGIDDFRMVTAVNNGTDRITDFAKGVNGDIFTVSIAATGISALKNGNSAAVAAAATVGVVSVGAATTLTAANNVIVLTGATFANAAAVQTAIEAGGTRVLTFATATTANDDIIVVWSDGTLGHISTVNIASAATTITATNATVADVATLVGITSIASGDFVAGNFAFIA